MTGFRAYAKCLFLLKASRISVLRKEAMPVIAQVLPLDKLREQAQGVARRPDSGRRHPRLAYPRPIRRRLFDERGFGIALEGLAAIALSH